MFCTFVMSIRHKQFKQITTMKTQIELLNTLLDNTIVKLNILNDYIAENDCSEDLNDHRKDLQQIIKQLDKILN